MFKFKNKQLSTLGVNVVVIVFVVAGLLILTTVVALPPKLFCLFISSISIIIAEVLVLFVSIFIDKVYVVPALKFIFVFVQYVYKIRKGCGKPQPELSKTELQTLLL